MNAAPLTVGVLQTGSVAPPLAERHGEYVDMFRRLLGAADPGLSIALWDVEEKGEIPASPTEADGWLVTGSRHGVYDDLPWIEPLKAFLRDVHDAGVPLAGVCFGHQIMAEALGGSVVKSDRGWGCGVHEYTLTGTAPWMADTPETLAIHAMHQDQVVAPPPGSRVIAESPFCPFAALAYGQTGFSIQPHPEFDADFERALIEMRRGNGVPEDVADDGLATIGQPVDSSLVGTWLARFFRHAAAHRQAA